MKFAGNPVNTRTLVRALACAIAVAIVALSPADKVDAGPYSDDLTKCLIRSTTDADRVHLVTWFFAAVSTHPSVRGFSSISQEKGEQISKRTAELVMRLLTDSCRSETVDAMKYEGANTMGDSFEALGAIAARGLISHPNVNAYIEGMNKYVDETELDDLGNWEQ